MAARVKRQYSREFSPRSGSGKSIVIHRIPTTFLEAVQVKARREGRSVRNIVLRAMQAYLEAPAAAPAAEPEL